jgi:SAM-dependent methyltransferase
MYDKSARYYDALYAWKDYQAETARLLEIVSQRNPGAKSLLDVACGTGKHLELLRDHFECEGVDLDPTFVEISSDRNPGLTIHEADFTSFDLGKRFDVVTCLFSAIGYAGEKLDEAIACMANHLTPGGLLIVEPWFTPEQWKPGSVHTLVVDEPDLKIIRMNLSEQDGNLSVMDMHHLVGTPEGVHHFVERHEMVLRTDQEYLDAFMRSGLKVELDEQGLMGRGLYVGTK